jgi:hypothetical protein
MSNVRAKFRCISEMRTIGGGVTYKFMPVTDDGIEEHRRFHKYTPSGELTLLVDNPDVVFTVGEYYYADLTRALDPVPA